ncbi:microprocessor complex subunit dgcr8 [Dermatophagoides farinae]|uniref:Microprocessor complex subunit dgcr8 n=1 Tax=Dermatophagoides farinae TaxID=6954 RepID=A0A9D4NXS9_DERFA|nr:microprocessor complex subunit dgcr8 [Dermatophagoides farinae]
MSIDKQLLISAVRKRRPLWDFKNKNFTKNERDKEWQEVCREVCGTIYCDDIKEIKKVWTSLLTIYRRHHKSIMRKRNGSIVDPNMEMNHVKWIYYMPLSFLAYNYETNDQDGSIENENVTPTTSNQESPSTLPLSFTFSDSEQMVASTLTNTTATISNIDCPYDEITTFHNYHSSPIHQQQIKRAEKRKNIIVNNELISEKQQKISAKCERMRKFIESHDELWEQFSAEELAEMQIFICQKALEIRKRHTNR